MSCCTATAGVKDKSFHTTIMSSETNRTFTYFINIYKREIQKALVN